MDKVSGADVPCSALSDLDANGTHLAGGQSLRLRVGVVGELGYEIHFADAEGVRVGDAMMAAGEECGIWPVGRERQRILRLQKLHILVGQDTDSESTPLGAALAWTVKLDKEEDFIGKWALEHYSQEAPAAQLVGFSLPDGQVPTEGSVVVDERNTPVGQVTSARYSPVLSCVIGMAWVPSAVAREGEKITISDAGRTMRADLQTKPFYDPQGEVLRS